VAKWNICIEGVWDDECGADPADSIGDLARAVLGQTPTAPITATYASTKRALPEHSGDVTLSR